MSMLVSQPFDGSPIGEIPADDPPGLARKLEQAMHCFADRPGWLPAHKRIDILRRLAGLTSRMQTSCRAWSSG
jgi:hypothetical protein